MSLHRRDAKRDANEAAIVEALRAAGATVERLSGPDLPDLLVGWQGANVLLEVKDPAQAKKAYRGKPGAGRQEMSDGQVAWRDAWRGRPPVIVRTPAEALVAIGAAP